MHALVSLGLVIASTIAQLSSAPVAFHWRAEDAIVEAISVSPGGVEAAFWCEALHGSSARCFAQLGRDEPVPIFRGGAIDAADRSLRAPDAGVRHFSMTSGNIDWNGDLPIFSVACHTGAIMAICQQALGGETEVAGPTRSPLDAQVARVGSTAVWNDSDLSHTVFRAAERTIDVCCAGHSTAYALVPLPAGDAVLIYIGAGWPTDLRAAVIRRDLTVQREIVLARGIVPPKSIAAVSAGEHLVVVWSGGGLFAAIDTNVVKLSNAGELPAIATDGNRIIAAWLDRGAVLTAELSRADHPRSLLALGAATSAPFLALDWSPKTGFLAHWRAQSAAPDDILVASRPVP